MTYEIRSGTPPAALTERNTGRPAMYPFREMSVNTYIVVRMANVKAARQLCYRAAAQVPGATFRYELLNNGEPVAPGMLEFNIWRLE